MRAYGTGNGNGTGAGADDDDYDENLAGGASSYPVDVEP